MAKVIYEDQVVTHDYSDLWLSSDTGVAVGDLTEELYRQGVEAVYDAQNQVVGIFVVGVHRWDEERIEKLRKYRELQELKIEGEPVIELLKRTFRDKVCRRAA